MLPLSASPLPFPFRLMLLGAGKVKVRPASLKARKRLSVVRTGLCLNFSHAGVCPAQAWRLKIPPAASPVAFLFFCAFLGHAGMILIDDVAAPMFAGDVLQGLLCCVRRLGKFLTLPARQFAGFRCRRFAHQRRKPAGD